MGLLKQIPQDYTFDQDKSVLNSIKWQKEGKQSWSYDLTAATDRIPLLLQGGLLKLIGFSLEFVQAWIAVMVENPFRDRIGNFHYYITGQGMGIYSS
jgi:hypothetical protein